LGLEKVVRLTESFEQEAWSLRLRCVVADPPRLE